MFAVRREHQVATCRSPHVDFLSAPRIALSVIAIRPGPLGAWRPFLPGLRARPHPVDWLGEDDNRVMSARSSRHHLPVRSDDDRSVGAASIMSTITFVEVVPEDEGATGAQAHRYRDITTNSRGHGVNLYTTVVPP